MHLKTVKALSKRRRPGTVPTLPNNIRSLRRRLDNLRTSVKSLDEASSALSRLWQVLDKSDQLYEHLIFEAAQDSHSVPKTVNLDIGYNEDGGSSILSLRMVKSSQRVSFHSREQTLFELQAEETCLRHILRRYAPPFTRKASIPLLARETKYAGLFEGHVKMLVGNARILREEVTSAHKVLNFFTSQQQNNGQLQLFVSRILSDLSAMETMIERLRHRVENQSHCERVRANPDGMTSASAIQYERTQRNDLLDSRVLRTVAFSIDHFDPMKTSKQRLVEAEMDAMVGASTSSSLAAALRSQKLTASRGPFGLAVDPSIELRPYLMESIAAGAGKKKSSSIFGQRQPSILLSDLELPFEKTLEKMGPDRSKQRMPRKQTNAKSLIERDRWL